MHAWPWVFTGVESAVVLPICFVMLRREWFTYRRAMYQVLEFNELLNKVMIMDDDPSWIERFGQILATAGRFYATRSLTERAAIMEELRAMLPTEPEAAE